jgi:UDP-N-acetylmuramate--alanine ligase
MHNVLNALSAIAVAVELNIPDDAVLKALAEFRGVGRRFQSYGDVPAHGGGKFTVIEDYGHHPVEMARRWPRRAAPSRAGASCWPSSRTATPARATASRTSCRCWAMRRRGAAVRGVFRRREPIVAADGRSLARAVRVAGKVDPQFVGDIAAMPQAVLDTVRDGDVVMCMGAGSIGGVPAKLVEMGGPHDQRHGPISARSPSSWAASRPSARCR